MSHLSYSLRLFPMSCIEDIIELREAKLIGGELKPGLLSSKIVAMRGDAGTGAFAVSVGETIRIRPTVPVNIREDDLKDIMLGIAHSMFAYKSVEMETTPIYTSEEVYGG